MILTVVCVLFFLLQVLLLPTQLYSYLILKIDKTRLRFLFLVLSVVGFNSLWFLEAFKFMIDPNLSEILLTYGGIFLVTHFYFYLSKELGISSKVYSALSLLIILLVTELLHDASGIVVSSHYLSSVKVFFSLTFQAIALVYGVQIIRHLFQNGLDKRSPFENASILGVVMSMLLPSVIFHVSVTSLYNVIVNMIFLVVTLAYFKHFVIKLRLEKRIFSHSQDFGNNLQEQFVQVPEVFFEYDLTPREREIAVYLLKGMSYEEIAEKLFRTSGAIRKQGSKAYAKAGVKNLVEFRKKFEFTNGSITPRKK